MARTAGYGSLIAHLAVVLAVAAHTHACGGDDACDLETRSRDLGGAGLIDCGVATGDPSVVDRCALTAYDNDETFRAVYEQEDGMLEAIVRVAGGDYLLLRETSDGIERVDCGGARVAIVAGRSFIECTELGEPRVDCH